MESKFENLSIGTEMDIDSLEPMAIDSPEPNDENSFNWAALPDELKLVVLEQSDLVAPEAVVKWDPIRKYRHRGYKEDASRYWKAPTHMFLVSKVFRAMAQKVNSTRFFSINKFVVSFNTRGFFRATNVRHIEPFAAKMRKVQQIPRDNAANEFFRFMATVGGLKHLRSVDFHSFAVSLHTPNDARQNWFCLFTLLQSKELYLHSVRIAGVKTVELPVALHRPSSDSITRLRYVIDKTCWKFVAVDGPPHFISKSLTVHLNMGVGSLYYIIRKASEDELKASDEICPPPTAAHVLAKRRIISYRNQDAEVGNEMSRRQDGLWVEEVWELKTAQL
ncbi:hypothetical protein F5Y18DRAFT_439859 [Xylariaceae sp. FL1019]|nr:hypothetical protein F5Y18DRAFT_439859 [Xylariaceae sp. FL1019]